MDNKLASFLGRILDYPSDSDIYNVASDVEVDVSGNAFYARIVHLDGTCRLEMEFEFPEDKLESIRSREDLFDEILASLEE